MVKKKERIKTFWKGDINTILFHRVPRIKRIKKIIEMSRERRDNSYWSSHIEQHKNLTNMLYTTKNCVPNRITYKIQYQKSWLMTKNENFCLILSHQEIRKILFDMSEVGATRLIGFNRHFYQTYSDIIGTNATMEIQHFFIDGKIQRINVALLLLMPSILNIIKE